MKILFIRAEGDYDAISFSDKYGGVKASDIIERLEQGEIFKNDDDDGKELDDWIFQLEVIEVGIIDMKFLDFIRGDIQDYEDSKHSNFWLENEIVD